MKTIKEVSEIFRVTERTVKRWLEIGHIKSIKIGGTVRIADEEVERLKRGDNNGK